LLTAWEAKLAKFKSEHRTASKNWDLPKNFPDRKILDAYMKPAVDESKEKFEFRTPDVPILRMYCMRQFGWSTVRTRLFCSCCCG
jgi:DNA excision repair protein ERCC-5